jgi:hypothetical protein
VYPKHPKARTRMRFERTAHARAAALDPTYNKQVTQLEEAFHVQVRAMSLPWTRRTTNR